MSNHISLPAGLLALAGLLQTTLAVNGSTSGNSPFTYTSGPAASVSGGNPVYTFKSASYEYTGLGAAECNIDFAPDGTLVYAPALTPSGNGIATSNDQGKTWSLVLPQGTTQPRVQPVFRQEQGRYFFWSSNPPGLLFSYSDDQGKTWSAPLNGSHFDYEIQDWAKLVSGKPVTSKLSPGVSEIMYLSAPSFISTPIPVQPLGPIQQLIMKSTDKGATWSPTKGSPTLQPALSGGACSGLLGNLADQELIIWGDGFVTPNGTVMYGLRRCQKLSVAISDDEGDTWRLSDVPGSVLPTFFPGDLTYLFNGNVLVPEPISMDAAGNIFAIWVDNNYILKMSKSSNYGRNWTTPLVIGAPGSTGSKGVMSYLPTLRQHPTVGRAALAYYGSADGGKTYQGYIAETGNLNSAAPVWTSIIGNNITAPLQANQDGMWDQGYGDPLYDLVEFMDVRYATNNSGFGQDNIVAGFSRSMCSAHSVPPQFYDTSSCGGGWDYTAKGQSRWQGIITAVMH